MFGVVLTIVRLKLAENMETSAGILVRNDNGQNAAVGDKILLGCQAAMISTDSCKLNNMGTSENLTSQIVEKSKISRTLTQVSFEHADALTKRDFRSDTAIEEAITRRPYSEGNRVRVLVEAFESIMSCQHSTPCPASTRAWNLFAQICEENMWNKCSQTNCSLRHLKNHLVAEALYNMLKCPHIALTPTSSFMVCRSCVLCKLALPPTCSYTCSCVIHFSVWHTLQLFTWSLNFQFSLISINALSLWGVQPLNPNP